MEKCSRGCGWPAVADFPVPVVNSEDRSMVLCVLHAEEAIKRGCHVILFGESEAIACARTDRILRERHRRLTGTDDLRFDSDGNFIGRAA